MKKNNKRVRRRAGSPRKVTPPKTRNQKSRGLQEVDTSEANTRHDDNGATTDNRSTNSSIRGRGDSGLILTDDKQIKSDARLVNRAVRGKWGIRRKPMIMRRLTEIVAKQSVVVLTKCGPFDSAADADTNAIAASRVLVAMNGQDQADDHEELKRQKGEPIAPNTNVNINVNVNDRSAELARLASQLGASRLLIDGREVEAAEYLRSIDAVPEAKAATGSITNTAKP